MKSYIVVLTFCHVFSDQILPVVFTVFRQILPVVLSVMFFLFKFRYIWFNLVLVSVSASGVKTLFRIVNRFRHVCK